MPLATRAALEGVIGVDAIAELLDIAVPANASNEQAETARQRRLDAALRAGDNLISQFITLPSPETASDVLRDLAVEEGIYFLIKHTKAGASAAHIEAATERRRDLRMMRKREQMPGSPEGQASHRPRLIEARGRYTTEVKKRYF